jgi:hypothetical protein
MIESDDRELDALLERDLRGHLAATLDPHVGKAAGAFLRQTGAAQLAGADAASTGPYRLWWWALATGGLAACVAIAWLIQALTAPHRVNPGPGRLAQEQQPPPQHTAELREVLRSVTWRTLDETTVVLDDVPLHRVRRQVIETEQWYDPDRKTHIEVTTPRQEVIFVGMRQQ